MSSVHLQKFESQKEGTTLRGSHKVEIGEGLDDNRVVESLHANPAEEVGLQVDFDSENRVLKPIDVQGYASNIIDPKLGKETTPRKRFNQWIQFKIDEWDNIFSPSFFSVGDSNPTIIYTPVKGVIATAGEEASEEEFIDDTAASSLIELSRSSRGQTEERSHRRSPTQQLIKIGDNVILVEMDEDDDMDMSASGTQQHPNNKNEYIIWVERQVVVESVKLAKRGNGVAQTRPCKDLYFALKREVPLLRETYHSYKSYHGFETFFGFIKCVYCVPVIFM